MVIKSEEFKKVCSTILQAVDNNSLSTLTETLEMRADNGVLNLNVTNREYYVNVKMPIDVNIEFHATVNAVLFLKLISQMTTDMVELSIDNNTLKIKGNGTYSLPLIYEGDKIINLPEITIDTITSSFDINSDILTSILNYNSKQVAEAGVQNNIVQHMYYVDEAGAITFATSGCVNNFTLPVAIKLMFNDRLVKLFKLFKGTNIKLDYGYSALTDTLTQARIKLISDNIVISAVLSDIDNLAKSVPVSAIRGMANFEYPYNCVINRNALIQSLNRLSLFFTSNDIKTYSTLIFTSDSVKVCLGYDKSLNLDNCEVINFTNAIPALSECSIILDIIMLKNLLDGCNEEYITLAFSEDSKCVVLKRGNIVNIIPKCA